MYSPPVGLDLDGRGCGGVVEEVGCGVPLVVNVVVGPADRQVKLAHLAVAHVLATVAVVPMMVASVLLKIEAEEVSTSGTKFT